jgi:hypothetical protein
VLGPETDTLEPLPEWVLRVRRILVVSLLIALLVCVSLIAPFAVEFQLLGPLILDKKFRPLGPMPRGTTCVKRIEKAYVWDCPDMSVFERHRLGCRIWMWFADPVGLGRSQ